MGALNSCVDGVEFQADGVLDVRGLFGTARVTRHFQSVDFSVRIRTNEPDERLAQLRTQVHDRYPALNLLKDAGVTVNAAWIAVA